MRASGCDGSDGTLDASDDTPLPLPFFPSRRNKRDPQARRYPRVITDRAFALPRNQADLKKISSSAQRFWRRSGRILFSSVAIPATDKAPSVRWRVEMKHKRT